MPHCLIALFTAAILAGCTTGTSAVINTFALISHGQENPQPPKAPGLHYLRVTAADRVVFLALGYIESGSSGETEVWYSAKGEVIKLLKGRIVGTAGLDIDWRKASYSALPEWPSAISAPLEYLRVRDEMPGYRFDIRETLTLRRIEPPLGTGLVDTDPSKLQWFEEQVASTTAKSGLPAAMFAIDASGQNGAPLYGYQCLSASVCISWQRVPEGKR